MRRLALLALPFLIYACTDADQAALLEPSASSESGALSSSGDPGESEALTGQIPGHASINQQLAAVRRATAAFHNFDVAAAAGYGVQLTPCFEQLPDGAQGFHYGNPALIDDVVELTRPEILLYEPQPGGHLRLVGVEYIVPLSFPEPPPLFGQHFHMNADAGLWALHLWNWRNNPSGMFEDWNPKVTCDNA